MKLPVVPYFALAPKRPSKSLEPGRIIGAASMALCLGSLSCGVDLRLGQRPRPETGYIGADCIRRDRDSPRRRGEPILCG